LDTNKLPFNVLDLLKQRLVESERIEYKTGWNPDAIIPTLCAFANDFHNLGGGYVVIGQNCDATGLPIFPPAGIPEGQIDKIQRELLAYCQLIQPPYFPQVTLETLEEAEGKSVLILRALGSSLRPHKAPSSVTSKNKTWHYYIRRFANTVEAKGETERELFSLASRVPFDDRSNHSAKISDLSKPLMIAHLEEVESALAEHASELSVEKLARLMNIADGPPESPIPKKMSVCCFLAKSLKSIFLMYKLMLFGFQMALAVIF
jgi:ATP-dependent DNA helicase RecG